MLSTRLPPVIAMCAACGLVMIRSVLKRPCDLISSSLCETCFSNSATIDESQIKQISVDKQKRISNAASEKNRLCDHCQSASNRSYEQLLAELSHSRINVFTVFHLALRFACANCCVQDADCSAWHGHSLA